MEALELARLERVVRNMITSRLKMEKLDGKHGEIYLAHGLNAEGTIVGIWGSRGMAHTYEFEPDSQPGAVRQALVNHASGVIAEFVDRDMLHA